jgi:hypothetical protein
VGIFTACATRGAAATNAGLDSLGGIDVLDVRGCQVEEPARILPEHLLLVDPPDNLDVLLRHRLPPQPHGFEGFSGSR